MTILFAVFVVLLTANKIGKEQNKKKIKKKQLDNLFMLQCTLGVSNSG